MYRGDWHSEHHEKTSYSARTILGQILGAFPAGSVLDIGCGHGDWLRAALDLGVGEVVGCDGPWTDRSALLIPQESFRCEDMRQPLRLGRRFDLALCLEVAEHLPEEHAADIVDTLTAHSDLILFGAAIPFQLGYRHLNEQWPSWWSRLFAARGFVHADPVRPAVWDDPSVHFWYKQNPLLYVREEREDLVERARALEAAAGGPMPLDVVHPDKYLLAAGYRDIAFKPLARALPKAVGNKVVAMLRRP